MTTAIGLAAGTLLSVALAEDQSWIVGSHATLKGPLGTFHRVVRSYEWTRLEPHVLSLKLYAAGVGIVRERDVAGGDEALTLVSVHRR